MVRVEIGDTVQLTSKLSRDVTVGRVCDISESINTLEYLIESPEVEPMWFAVYSDGTCIRILINLSRKDSS
jgi:hypothetical protein